MFRRLTRLLPRSTNRFFAQDNKPSIFKLKDNDKKDPRQVYFVESTDKAELDKLSKELNGAGVYNFSINDRLYVVEDNDAFGNVLGVLTNKSNRC